MGLVRAQAPPPMTPLEGGVSSDIWRVDLPAGPVCVKRALPRLKVAAVWEAPVERNRYEWEWMREAGRIVPSSVPPLVAHDVEAGCFAMGFLDPAAHPLWKAQLRGGIADETTARAVGERLAAIHNGTAGRADVRARFSTDDIFHAIRLEPYLVATAAQHPDLAAPLEAVVSRTANTKHALVHGDVSPKNILIGPDGPDLPRRRMRLVRRSGVRSRLLPEPPSPESASGCRRRDRPRSSRCVRLPRRDATSTGRRLGGARRRSRSANRGASAARACCSAGSTANRRSSIVTAKGDRERMRRTARPLILKPPASLAGVRKTWAEARPRPRQWIRIDPTAAARPALRDADDQ